MSTRGHSIIINMSNWMPFVFTFNPENIETEKKISYAVTPNIGGASKRRYFSGFEAKEVSFKIKCVDMQSTYGVMPAINYFEQLRSPDPGLFAGWDLGYGNQNYPPPQVLFQFGVSVIPLVWDVLDVKMNEHHFHDGHVRGVIGVPKVVDIDLKLGLDEDHVLNKANKIAEKAGMIAASADSILREASHIINNTRKERTFVLPGMTMDRKW